MLRRITKKAEHRHWIVARLHLHHREIHRAPVDARRRTGLQPPLRQRQLAQPRRQRQRRRIARPPAGVVLHADVDQAIEEGAGGEHHRRALEADAGLRHHAGHAIATYRDVIDRLLEQRQIGLVLQPPPHRRLVQHAVGLRPRGAHRRPFRGIEDAELDARLVGGRRHRPTQRIDLLDQMALADTADRRIAAHRAERLDVVGEQQRRRPHARRRQRRLGPGMAATDHDHVKPRGIKHVCKPGRIERAGILAWNSHAHSAAQAHSASLTPAILHA